MMRFIVEIWPSLIPVVAFLVWWTIWGKKHKREGTLTEKHKKFWLWTLLATIIVAAVCLLIVAFSNESNREGDYVPAKIIDGKIVPGSVK